VQCGLGAIRPAPHASTGNTLPTLTSRASISAVSLRSDGAEHVTTPREPRRMRPCRKGGAKSRRPVPSVGPVQLEVLFQLARAASSRSCSVERSAHSCAAALTSAPLLASALASALAVACSPPSPVLAAAEEAAEEEAEEEEEEEAKEAKEDE